MTVINRESEKRDKDRSKQNGNTLKKNNNINQTKILRIINWMTENR